MAFDAGMLRFAVHEIDMKLRDGKVEKIYEPIPGEIVLQIKKNGTHRLLINAGSAAPRICITEDKTENPANPPMFCMLLRKHLSGGRLSEAVQLGFERAARLTFEVYDELGYKTNRIIFVEIMGKYSNIILTDGDEKILGASRIVDFSQSVKRQILPGMRYELPPPQDKIDPLTARDEVIFEILNSADRDMSVSKLITRSILGISSGNADQITYDVSGSQSSTAGELKIEELYGRILGFIQILREYSGKPYIVRNSDGTLVDFSFIPQTRYGHGYTCEEMTSFGELITVYYRDRAREERIKRNGADVLRLISNAESRIKRKMAAQNEELLAASDADKMRLYGDLITANIYRLKKGLSSAVLEDYTSESCDLVEIPLDSRLTPSANAQMYYKKYAKAKTALRILEEQLVKSTSELEYLATVSDALSRAETEKELIEIRNELRGAGYASTVKSLGRDKKNPAPTILRFETSGGYEVLCGKSNTANDYLTFKLAERDDWWFHVKNLPGSHVVMKCSAEDDPPEKDFTEAATIAAAYSKAAEGTSVPVDYTRIRYVKKPPSSMPGFVTYSKNWTAYVTSDAGTAEALKKNGKSGE